MRERALPLRRGCHCNRNPPSCLSWPPRRSGSVRLIGVDFAIDQDQSLFHCQENQISITDQVVFHHDLVFVKFDRLRTKIQMSSDLFEAKTLREQLHDFGLARGEGLGEMVSPRSLLNPISRLELGRYVAPSMPNFLNRPH